jgi:hypothetical protein
MDDKESNRLLRLDMFGVPNESYPFIFIGDEV